MWYKNSIFYSLDVKAFYDSNGDGTGDLQGVINKLNYINSLGCNCLWLLPFYPSPKLDNGYDVKDYYNVDPLIGTLGDFVQLVDEANQKGIKIIIDLVINHTSTEHPWFLESQSSRDSKYRNFYIWDDNPKSNESKVRLEGVRDNIWEYSEKTGSYYLHEYFSHQADLNLANPEVVEEVLKIMEFWLKLGVSGFRIDAAHAVTNAVNVDHIDFGNLHTIFGKMNDLLRRKNPEAILLGEASVQPDELTKYFISSDGNPRLDILFNFISNKHTFLSFARESGDTLNDALDLYDEIENAHWLNFVRHHDELNLELLNDAERKEVWDAYAPDENMRIFGHGIRRRLPPMLKNNVKRMKLFYAVIFGLPGIPLINFGEEIGMGDDLDLEGRESVRTPMQWSEEKNAGFSVGSKESLYRPVISDGEFSYKKVNVRIQQYDPGSFLNYICRLIRIRQQNPIIGMGHLLFMQPDNNKVAAWCFEYTDPIRKVTSKLMLTYNLSGDEVKTSIKTDIQYLRMIPVFEDDLYSNEISLSDFHINPYGFRWIQIFEKMGVNY